jgi:hypothetical protein
VESTFCRSVDSKAVMENIIGRATLWRKEFERGTYREVRGPSRLPSRLRASGVNEESMGHGSTAFYYCQGLL